MDDTQKRLWELAKAHQVGAGSNMLYSLLSMERSYQDRGMTFDWRIAAIELANLANQLHDMAVQRAVLEVPTIIVDRPPTSKP